MFFNFKKNYFLFFVFLCIGIVFITLSTTLIIRVNSIRQTVEDHVGTIGILSRFEAETFLILSNIEKSDDSKLSEDINQLISFPDVPLGMIDFSNLKSVLKTKGRVIDKKGLADALSLLKKNCQYAIGENRQQLRLNSEKLLNYWNYTHILLTLASIAFLILPFIAYKITKTRDKLVRLQKKNHLLFDNSINIIISCNDKNEIIEFNTAAQQAFGYSFSEIRNKPTSVLYANPHELERVNNTIRNRDSFTGEVLNVTKNGNTFSTFLFANVIKDEKGVVIASVGISRNIKS